MKKLGSDYLFVESILDPLGALGAKHHSTNSWRLFAAETAAVPTPEPCAAIPHPPWQLARSVLSPAARRT